MRNFCVNYFEFGQAVHEMMFKGFFSIFSSGGHFLGAEPFRQFGREHDQINFSYFCRPFLSNYFEFLLSDEKIFKFLLLC